MSRGDGLVKFQALRDEVKRRIDLVELIAPHIAGGLKRRPGGGGGGEFQGACPFHGGDSFYVIPAKGLWHCFGCSASGDAFAFMAQHFGLSHRDAVHELAVRLGLEAVQGHEAGADSARAPLTPLAHAPIKTRDDEAYRRKSIDLARQLWQSLDPLSSGHPRLLAYLRHRGIDPAWLPGGTLPPTVRFAPSCPLRVGREQRHLPALVAAFGPRKGELTAVQRIYLDPVGDGKVPAELLAPGDGQDEVSAKMSLGSFSAARGGAIRLSPPDHHAGTLVLCEGVETGLAVLAALSTQGPPPAVWSVCSTAGYQSFDLHPEHVAGRGEGGFARRVLVAADLNRRQERGKLAGQRAGSFFGELALARVLARWPSMPVALLAPTHAFAPTLVGVEGDPIGHAADWLDVLNALGPAATGAALAAALPPAAEASALLEAEAFARAQDAEGGERPELPTATSVLEASAAASGLDPDAESRLPNADGSSDPPLPPPPSDGPDGPTGADGEPQRILGPTRTDKARELLLRRYAPPALQAPASVWRIRYHAGRWWVYSSRDACWREVEQQALLLAEAGALFDGYYVRQANGAVKRWAPSSRNVEDVLEQAIVFTAHGGDMPAWCPPAFAGDGRPLWHHAVVEGRGVGLEPGQDTAGDGGPWPRPEAIVATTGGLIDTDAYVQGVVRVLPATPRWFARSAVRVPYAHAELVQRLGELVTLPREQADAWLEERCPRWHAFLGETFAYSPQAIGQLQRWFGYVLTPDIALQKILWLQGVPGSGKGTIREVMTAVVGEQNVAMTSVNSLAGRFDLGSFVGRSLVFLPEVRVGFRTDSAEAMDRLLSISGGDPQPVEDKFAAKQPLVRMSCKFVVTPNEEPRFTDAAAALIRRLLVIPTGQPPLKPDPGLPAALKAELPGIILWAIEGLRRLRQDGGFEQPPEGVEIVHSIKRTLSVAWSFVEDACVLQPGSEVDTGVLYRLFTAWCEQQGMDRPPSAESFGRQLRAAAPGIDRVNRTTSVDGATRRVRHYTGVRPLLPGEAVDDPFTPRVIRTWTDGASWDFAWGDASRVSQAGKALGAGPSEAAAEPPAPF